MRKKVFTFSLIVLLLCPMFVSAAEVDATISSGAMGTGGGWNGVADARNSWLVGIDSFAAVRLTVVDKHGKRLELKVNGKTYQSRTLDFYDYNRDGYANNLAGTRGITKMGGKSYLVDAHNGLLNSNDGKHVYVQCGTVEQGDNKKVPTLCNRGDYSDYLTNGEVGLEGDDHENGINSDRNLKSGYVQGVVSRVITPRLKNMADGYRNVESDGSTLANFRSGWTNNGGWSLPYGYTENQGNLLGNIFMKFKGIKFENEQDLQKVQMFEDIFQRLMGISLNEIEKYSGATCDTNKKALQEAFIIVEPVSNINGYVHGYKGGWGTGMTDFIGSATELGIILLNRGNDVFGNVAKLVAPSMFNAARISDEGSNPDEDFKAKYQFRYGRVTPSTQMPLNGSFNRNHLADIIEHNWSAYGLGALRFADTSPATQKMNCYNYSIDAACTDCESKNSDNRAYVIQDTTNWEAIKNSREYNSAVPGIGECVKEHFYNDAYDVYCREEYHVFLPNQNNKIVVQTGKYFTLNRDRENADSTIVIPNDVPDFKPIRVEKVRECTGANDKLVSFEANSKEEFIGKSGCDGAGTIEVSYSEGMGDNGYKIDSQKLKPYNKNYSQNISGDMLTQKLVNYYTLDTDTFRYIRKKDGKSVSKKEDGESYVDLGIGNLPISFRNNKANVQVSFGYKLPKCDSKYKMSSAFNGSCILSNDKSAPNIYKKYSNKEELTSQERIEDSACVKLYGAEFLNDGNNEYAKEQHQKLMACISGRTENKSGNCVNSLSINTGDKNDVETKNNEKDSYSYVCFEPVVGKPHICEYDGTNYYDDSGKKVSEKDFATNCCTTKEIAEQLGRSWNSEEGFCCPYGQTYDSVNNTCGSRDDTCPKEKWNSAKGECCPVGEEYNKNTKKCEVPCDGLKCDTDSNGKPACCTDSSGNASCGYYKNGNLICPGKPSFDDIIYRPIDLSQPFIAQNGSERKAGENWCTVVEGVLKCNKEENTVVKTIIEDSNVSEENAMYKVKLDPDTIREIRNYNKEAKTYNDWDLECASDGKACTSKFLRETINDKVEGRCAGVKGKDAFYNCG